MSSIQARSLRGTATPAERSLWRVLRDRQLGVKFRRQHPFDRYILDFACVEQRLVVECDGGQHAESQRDETRDAVLERHGWRVLRFWNNEVLENLEGVVERIRAVLETLSREREREGPMA